MKNMCYKNFKKLLCLCVAMLFLISSIFLLRVKAEQEDDSTVSNAEYQTFEELNGKTISLVTGVPFKDLIASKVPSAKEYTYYQTMPDLMLAVKSGKSDAAFTSDTVADFLVNRDSELALFPENLGYTSLGFGFAKGDERCKEWQEAFNTIPEETRKEIYQKWVGADDSIKTVPEQDWAGTNGTVKVAANDSLEPMSYVGQDGKMLGYDIEIILLIAKKLDIHVEFMPMDLTAVLSSMSAGKADAICGSIVITDERKETMDFVEYHTAAYVLIVRSVETVVFSEETIEKESTFWGSIKESFEKTFIREDRYKQFGEGILTTIIITLLSILFGTVLGFIIFLGCRNGNKAANGIAGLFVWLIQGMPVVVLLMILYYIIFSDVPVSGTTIAVIAFTLVFGSGVFGMLKMGVGAIDKGQTEAALALGYGDIQTFFRIILPQAIPHFLPAYKGEIIALLKATAIVGYIAVQDLTKMGDLIRARTYEAFFPLIAVAVIYFILGGIFTFIVERIEIKINPKQRKKEEILKGVHSND